MRRAMYNAVKLPLLSSLHLTHIDGTVASHCTEPNYIFILTQSLCFSALLMANVYLCLFSRTFKA